MGLGDHVSVLVLGDREQPVHLVHRLLRHADSRRNGCLRFPAEIDVAHVGAHGRELAQRRGDRGRVAGAEELGKVLDRDAQRFECSEEIA